MLPTLSYSIGHASVLVVQTQSVALDVPCGCQRAEKGMAWGRRMGLERCGWVAGTSAAPAWVAAAETLSCRPSAHAIYNSVP